MNNRKIKNPKFLLTIAPMQFMNGEIVRPDGCLGTAYLDSALTNSGYHSKILDMAVGDDSDSLSNTFFNQSKLDNNFIRIGLTNEKILEKISEYDVIGISSVFTPQTSRVFEISNLIKLNFPDKIIIGGGVNARILKEKFFENGFDVIFNSEAEQSIVEFARYLESDTSLDLVNGISYMVNGKMKTNPIINPLMNLDELHMPSWHKLPYKQYWEISKDVPLWGGRDGLVDKEDTIIKYGNIFTSRGCPFSCEYCHISLEKDDEYGKIGKLRLHSIERVVEELHILKDLGIKYLFINDESLLANKKRVAVILEKLKSFNFKLADINGINMIHFFMRSKKTGKLVVDEEMIELLSDAGFRKISLPFESANQRIINKWCGRKWMVEKCDTKELVKKLNDYNITTDGNFMIGFPDETPDELENTFNMAREHMNAGMVGSAFMIVQPFPGSKIFQTTIDNGQLSKDWHWDELGWAKGSPFTNMKISNETLIEKRVSVWREIHGKDRINEFTNMGITHI